ncbi:MAG: VOC family protein [Candidatus Aminicenantes bacterium]|nr:VOC family protein [Candidatus Aminicenantes bacterium]
MAFTFAHNNINVFDLPKSLKFYGEALGLGEVRRIAPEDGSFILVFLGDGQTAHRLELTWLRDRAKKYNLGDNEIHLAFRTDDYDEAFRRHKAMEVVCFENPKMGIYFIEDPDGYWLEILPPGRA